MPETDVRQQTDVWIPDRWRAQMHDAPELVAAIDRLEAQLGTKIHRDGLLDLADAVAQGGASSTLIFLGAMAWGYGKTGYGPSRIRALLDTLADPPAELDAMFNSLREMPPDTAYRHVLIENHFHGLGESFGTKLMYFAGYRRGQSGRLQPLILDKNVRRALWEAGCRFPGQAPDPLGYELYVRLAEQWRAQLAWAEADSVEWSLFRVGERAFAGDSDQAKRQRREWLRLLQSGRYGPSS